MRYLDGSEINKPLRQSKIDVLIFRSIIKLFRYQAFSPVMTAWIICKEKWINSIIKVSVKFGICMKVLYTETVKVTLALSIYQRPKVVRLVIHFEQKPHLLNQRKMQQILGVLGDGIHPQLTSVMWCTASKQASVSVLPEKLTIVKSIVVIGDQS